MNKKAIGFYLLIIIAAIFYIFTSEPVSEELTPKAENEALNIQEWKTKNNVRVLYVNAPELPMLDVQVVFDAGSVRNGEQPGLASLTNSMLSHGAKMGNETLSIDDITERFDSVGARFGTGASRDNAEISLRTLTDESWLVKSLTTMQAVINQPTFDEKELERVRKQRLISFESRKQSPSTIANEAFYKTLYKEHPYALPGIGTEESIKNITRNDLIDFYKKYYVAKNALVTIVGSINKEKAAAIAEQLVGKLPQGEKSSVLPEVSMLAEAQAKHFEFPSSQTHILMGQPGIHRTDEDYFTLYVANHILGGSGFGSRIMKEIREKRGLAYSSYSYFVPLLKPGPFLMGMQTSNNQTEEAKKVLKQTLADFIEQGPTEKELTHAKKNITGGFPLRIDSNGDISNYLAVIGFYQLPLSYLSDFNQRIDKITTAQIKEAMQRRIDPEKMVTITVGSKVADKS